MRRLDPSLLLFAGVAVVLCLLVALPIGWLGWYSVTDAGGQVTLANFVKLFTDASMRKPLVVTLQIALGSALAACVVATPLAWLVARTDLPWRRSIRALVTASFVTPPFLGAVAWELSGGAQHGDFEPVGPGVVRAGGVSTTYSTSTRWRG